MGSSASTPPAFSEKPAAPERPVEGTVPRQADAARSVKENVIRGHGDAGYDAATQKLGRYYQPPARELKISATQKTFPQLPSDWPMWAQQRRTGNTVIALGLFAFVAGTFYYTIDKFKGGDFEDIKNERRI